MAHLGLFFLPYRTIMAFLQMSYFPIEQQQPFHRCLPPYRTIITFPQMSYQIKIDQAHPTKRRLLQSSSTRRKAKPLQKWEQPDSLRKTTICRNSSQRVCLPAESSSDSFKNILSGPLHGDSRKQQSRVEADGANKKAFREVIHHSHPTFNKGSYRLVPRNSASKKEAFNSYLKVQHLNLDKTYYFKRILNPNLYPLCEKSPSLKEQLFSKQSSEQSQPLQKNKVPFEKHPCSSVPERAEMWGLALSKLRAKLVTRAKGKGEYELGVGGVESENLSEKRQSGLLRSGGARGERGEKEKEDSRLFDGLVDPWSTKEIRLSEESSFVN